MFLEKLIVATGTYFEPLESDYLGFTLMFSVYSHLHLDLP